MRGNNAGEAHVGNFGVTENGELYKLEMCSPMTAIFCSDLERRRVMQGKPISVIVVHR